MLSKTEGNSPTLCISRGRVYAHMRACADKQEEACTHKGIAAAHRKKQVDEPFPTRRNNRNTVKLIRNQGHFFQGTERKAWKNPFLPPRKNPGFSGSVPLERSVLCHPKNKNFPGIAVFCQPEDKNFPKTASSAPAGRRKKWTRRPFFSPSWEIPAKIPPPKGKKSEKNSGKTENGATCPQTEPGFFHAAGQMTSRKSRIAGTFLHRTARIFYVSLPGNVRSTRQKPTVPGRKTYGLHTGNIENIKEKRGYPADIFRIRNTGKTNGPFTGKEQKSRIRKNKVNSLRGNLQKTRKIKADWKQKTSRTDIKKGVPLNSNLC